MDSLTKGVVAIFTNERGNVIATANDFSRGGAAGFTEKERQTRRATDALYMAVAEAYCSPDFFRGIRAYTANDIIGVLINEHKCKISFAYIGYEGE